jgi:hypothetical protein
MRADIAKTSSRRASAPRSSAVRAIWAVTTSLDRSRASPLHANHPTSATVPASAAASEQAGKRASSSLSRANAAATIAASERDHPRNVILIAKAAGLAREPIPAGGDRRPGTFACERD